jgi:hypothetical protein
MKRCLSIIAFVFILFNTSYSQLTFKAFAGVNITSLEDENELNISDAEQASLDSDFHRLLNPSLGIQMQFYSKERINLNLESQFIVKGQGYGENNKVERSIYIELIPTIDIDLGKGFSFGLGPYLGFRPYTYFSEKNSVSTASYIRNDWDYGGIASASYNVKRLTFRFAYFAGSNTVFRDIFPIKNSNKLVMLSKRNRVMQFSIGYTLRSNQSKSTPTS